MASHKAEVHDDSQLAHCPECDYKGSCIGLRKHLWQVHPEKIPTFGMRWLRQGGIPGAWQPNPDAPRWDQISDSLKSTILGPHGVIVDGVTKAACPEPGCTRTYTKAILMKKHLKKNHPTAPPPQPYTSKAYPINLHRQLKQLQTKMEQEQPSSHNA